MRGRLKLLDNQLQIQEAINELSSQEAKQFLTKIKHQLDIVKENNEAKKDLYKDLKELYEKLLIPVNRISKWEPNATTTKVHIVFSDSIAGSLKFVIKQLGYADTNKVICFRNQFSIGPLWQLHEEVGQTYRAEWFRDNINNGDEDSHYNHDYGAYHQRLTEKIAHIPAAASIVIWGGKNAHEQVGLRYAVYMLKKRQNRIIIFNAVDACQSRFDTTDRSIEYLHAGEMSSEKLKAVFGESEEKESISCETRHLLENEWLSLAKHHEVLRIWDGERVLNVEANYFDSYLLETLEKLHTYRSNNDFIKASRIIGEALGYCNQYIGDSYFEYRLRQLIYNGSLEIKGVPRAMRFYSVRRK